MDFTIPADICRLDFKKFSENFVNLLLVKKMAPLPPVSIPFLII